MEAAKKKKKTLSNIFKSHSQAHTNSLHVSPSLPSPPYVTSCCVIFFSKEALRLETSGMLPYRSQCSRENKVKANILSWQSIKPGLLFNAYQEVSVCKMQPIFTVFWAAIFFFQCTVEPCFVWVSVHLYVQICMRAIYMCLMTPKLWWLSP